MSRQQAGVARGHTDVEAVMHTHRRQECPICREYRGKLRALIRAYGDTREERYYERAKQVLDR